MDEKVQIGKGIFSQLPRLANFKKYSRLFLIIDKEVSNHLNNKIEQIFPKDFGKIIILGGEQTKNIETIQKIWNGLLDYKCDRKSLVINIGGGTIGDIGGFAAATYMRGVDFVQIPTTLLAQVDSSVGGKVGINFANVKNLIGAFQQPTAVIIDVEMLSTLPRRELISGFAEIIKHGVIADKEYFYLVASKKPQDFSQEELVKIIKHSIEIKSKIVSADEKENSMRKLLNFGHTIGHAIEALSQGTDKPLIHGEAISIGMAIEGKISKLMGILSEKELLILENALLNAGLPIKIPNIRCDQIMNKITSDKKNEKGKTSWTLLQSIGKAIYDQIVDEEIIRRVI